mmetsp:Transcript_88596/g.247833  ORF Transcript_88596/g.247833 Transcript_88596/m.247833 type:complete len:586 (+) Transcript_88596:69-1826(+)
MERVASKAEELGLELNDEALDSLADMSFPEACELLEQVSGKGGSIRNPSAYISRAVSQYEPGKGDRGKGGGKRPPGGKSAARAEELGLDLDEEALQALANIPLSAALELVEDTAGKGGDIRNPSGWIVKACTKIVTGGGKGGKGPSRKGGGGKSAARAEELGLQLDDAALDALSSIPLSDALQLVEDTASKSVRNPSSYISAACHTIVASGGKKGGKGGWHDRHEGGGGGMGSRSAARAAEHGLDLEDSALEALANVPLGDALNLLDDMAAKGAGKGGGIRNPSAYVISACAKMNSAPPAIGKGKGPGPGGHTPSRPALVAPSYSNRSADRAAELGIHLNDEAISALGAIALRDAYSLLEDMAGKGKGAIRNPSAYVIGAVNKMTGGGGGGGGSDWGSRNIVGKGRAPAHGASLEQRIIDLNRSGIWGGEKIDVEAMMALKRLSDGEAHDLLDSLEAKGGGSRGGVRNPSNYIGAAVNRMVGESGGGGPRKRTRTEYERPQYEDDRRGRGRVGRGDSMVAEEARRMGLSLDGEALEALERQNEDDALQLLDQVAEQGGKIKNPSKYIASACSRGLEFRDAKRARL